MIRRAKDDIALYIDERATKEQIDSLATIYSGQGGVPPLLWLPD